MKDVTFGAYNVFDFRALARQRLPKGLFEFVDRGTEDEISLRRNRTLFERIKLKPRTLVNVSDRSQSVTLFGHECTMPIAIAPTGSNGLMWYEGEIALARAAAAAGIPFVLATGSMTPMERVVVEAGGRIWFQLYMWPDRSLSYRVVERAKAAGCEALVITVDAAVSANREYNLRNGYTVPFTFTRRNVTDVVMHPRWLFGVLVRYLCTTGMPRFENYPSEVKAKIIARPMDKAATERNDSLTWDDLRVLRDMWPHTLIVKGILTPTDAVLAAECGADGIIVSNHGGRNLDSSLAPIEVLPEVVEAVGNRVAVMVDSGFRRGSDVVKALALGAKAVLIGRPTLYGLAVGGEAGAARAIGFFRDEIDRTLALIGCPRVEALNRDDLCYADVGVPSGSAPAL